MAEEVCMNAFVRPVRLAIVGSRGFAELDRVRDYVAKLHPKCTVISGGARGVDTVAELAARARGLAVEVFHADWEGAGRRAGLLRNRRIVESCEELVAFWDGRSPGTRNSLDWARQLRRPVEVVLVPVRLARPPSVRP
jgi:hypothetical protein